MRTLVGVLLLTSLAACNTMPPAQPPPTVPPFPQGWTIVDLTRPLDWRAPALPHPDGFPFERIDLQPVADSNRRVGGFTTLEQMGTHVAAPKAHGGAEDAASMAARDLVLPLVVVDVPPGGGGGVVTVDTIHAFEVAHGLIPERSLVVLRTGLGAAAPEDAAYEGRAEDGTLRFAGWTPDAVTFLIVSRRVRALGTDALALDPADAIATAPAQSTAAAAGVFVVAGLGDLAALPSSGGYAVIGALPIVGGTGAPCRVLALLPPEPPRPPEPGGAR